jgi:hypothetical protein
VSSSRDLERHADQTSACRHSLNEQSAFPRAVPATNSPRGCHKGIIEFFHLREDDDAHATLDRITHIGTDLEAVKVKAKSLFETLNMPQKPDGLRILDQDGDEVFFWTPGAHNA